MLATTVFDEDGHPTQGRHVNVVRLSVPALSGGVLQDMDPDSQTNHTVLAVRPGDTFLTDTDEGIQQFRDRLTEASESS